MSRSVKGLILFLAVAGFWTESLGQNEIETAPEDRCIFNFSAPNVRSLTDGTPRSCIKVIDVNRAYARASAAVAVPSGDPSSDPAVIGALGELFQATTEELLKNEMVGLSVLNPIFDITDTELEPLCPAYYKPGGVTCSWVERFRRIDGYCSGLGTWWPHHFGASSQIILRDLPASYRDGISSPRALSEVDDKPLPTARAVSNAVHARGNRHDQSLSMLFVAFGQFLDHDITLTGNFAQNQGYLNSKIDCCARPDDHRTCMPIEIPANDTFYRGFGTRCLNFLRVLPGLDRNCRLTARNQFNAVTPVIDASAVYGSSYVKANRLRDPDSKGKLLTTSFGGSLDQFLKPILPEKRVDPDADCIRPNGNVFCFDAGDDRVTEQPLLTSMHVIFVRAHNAIAGELWNLNMMWDSDTVYEETRRIVGAIVQHVVINEFLPALLPSQTLAEYGLRPEQLFRGKTNVAHDPQVSQSFAAAAFRFAHTLLPDQFFINSRTHVQIGSFRLRDLFNRPDEMRTPGRVDQFLLGALNQPADASDASISDEVRQFLFQEPGKAFGMDLAARNIQRGREHGLGGYTEYRARRCGLSTINSWSDMQLHFPNATVAAFRSVYRNVQDIDLWSAGIAENKVPGSILGPTFACLIGDQFKRLVLGDRFWYENSGYTSSFTPDQLREIKKMTFARLLCDHSDGIRTIQKKAFLLPNFDSNPRVTCCSDVIPRMSFDPWRPMVPRD